VICLRSVFPVGPCFLENSTAVIQRMRNTANTVPGMAVYFQSVQNINIMRSSYVPGLGYPKAAQQYGARWFFTN